MIIDRKNYELFGKMVIEKLVISSPFQVPSPMPNEACFLYVIQGEINYRLDLNDINIPAKDAVLLKCGNYFGEMITIDSSKLQMIIIVHFHPAVLKKIYGREYPEILRNPKTINAAINVERINNELLIQKYIEGLLFYFDNPLLVSEEILILKLKEIILLLAQTKNVSAIQQILSQLISPSAFYFQKIIEDKLYTNISLIELATLTNLSISSFKREFKKIYNDTPSSYLKTKKLEKAAELLVLSNERITDISFNCGFNDLAHFSKCFHEKYKSPPSSYRMNLINK